MFERIRNVFAKSPTGQSIQTEDISYAANALTQSGLFAQYNPDALLGRKGYRVYKQMMTDEQVKAVVRFHRDAVTGRAWIFEDNDELSPEDNELRKQVLTKAVMNIPGSFKTRLDMIMSSLYTGFSLVEKSFDLMPPIEGKTWVGIKSLTLKPFDTFYFTLDDFGQLRKLEQQIGGYYHELDINKFIHHVCNPDIHEFYGQSELREAYRAWYSKDTTILLQNIYLERSAAGFVWATPKDGSTLTSNSPEYANLINVLSKIRSNSAMVLPNGIELQIHHPNDTQAFERAITSHDKAIAKALLMPNLLGLSEQGPNGSRALGETQLEAFLWMLDAEATQLEEALNEQLFADLAELNWPDGLFPRFTMKELSNKQKMEVIDKWVALTGSNVVRKTLDDEDHIRASLGFPDYNEENDGDTVSVDPKTALSGVQVDALMKVVAEVAGNRMPRDTGINIILNSFPITREKAEEIMGTVGNGFEPENAEPAEQPAGDITDDSDENPSDELPAGEAPNSKDDEETIVGKGRKRVSAEMAVKKAVERVDFKVIERKSEDIAGDNVKALSAAIREAASKLLSPITDKETVEADDIKNLKFDGRSKNKINRRTKSMLTDGWMLGVKHAQDEVNKAKGQNMSVDFARLDTNASEYFDAKAFTITGKITEDMRAIAANILQNSIKTEQSMRDTVDEIYRTYAAQGFITPEDAEAEMAGILGTETQRATTARLNNVVRTNTFEAINEARYSYFTDPGLDDFVRALEYSAILDGRTTAICQNLDGHVHAANGEVWNSGYRPPNHYNCRSLLVPVTEFDQWEESPAPEVQPQEGFQ